MGREKTTTQGAVCTVNIVVHVVRQDDDTKKKGWWVMYTL